MFPVAVPFLIVISLTFMRSVIVLVIVNREGMESHNPESDTQDQLLVDFFNSTPGLDKFYSLFDQETFSSFLKLSRDQIFQRLGQNVPHVDDVIDQIINSREIYSEERNSEENINADELYESENGVQTGQVLVTETYVKRRIYLHVTPIVVVKSCLINKSQLCLNCEFNQGLNVGTDEKPKLCEKLVLRTNSSAVQIKPFPIAHFTLVVNDQSLLNRINHLGIRDVSVRKEVGSVLFDFLKSIFP